MVDIHMTYEFQVGMIMKIRQSSLKMVQQSEKILDLGKQAVSQKTLKEIGHDTYVDGL